MNSLLSLIISVIFLLISAGIGRAIHHLWRADENTSALERLVIDTALGLGAVSMALFAVGALKLFSFLWVFIGILALIALRYLPDVARDCTGTIKTYLRGRRTAFSIFAAILLLVLAVSALIPALAPPSMSDYDTLSYHLSVPKLYLHHGGIYYIDFTSHSNFPFLMEMLYIPGLALGSPVAAKLMNYWVGVLLVASVWVLVRKHLHEKAALLAALAFAGMPIVLWEATTAYVDLATALYSVLCIHLLLNYFDTNDSRFLVGSAIAAGFAASTKMTGLALIPLIVVWLIAHRFAEQKKFELKRVLMFIGIALLVCSPWYIKSFVYTGNPVYPFFYSVFGGKNWTSSMAQVYSSLQAKFGVGHDFASFVFLPYDLAFYSERFYDTPGLFIGPIFLIALPLLCFAKYKSKKIIGLLGFFLAQMVIWFKLTQQSRYLIPDLAIIAALVASILYLDSRFRIARLACVFAFVLTSIFGIYTLIPAIENAAPLVFGRESQDQYLSRSLDIYACEKYINTSLPKDAKIALYGDIRGFYLDKQYVWADPGHNTLFTSDFNSVEDILRYWKSLGITHLLVNHRFFPTREHASGVATLIYKAIDDGKLEPLCSDGYSTNHPDVYAIAQ